MLGSTVEISVQRLFTVQLAVQNYEYVFQNFKQNGALLPI
jgi:hypothetical protein